MSAGTGKDMSVAADRLAAAVADLQRFRDEWDGLGRPSMIEGSMRSLVAHPLVKMIRDAERAVLSLSAPSVAKGAGRPVGAQSAPDRKSKLRSV